MILPTILLSVLGAATQDANEGPTIGLIVANPIELDADERTFLIARLGSLLESETRRRVVVDDFARSAEEFLSAQADAGHVVALSLVAGARLMRIQVACHDRKGVLSAVRLEVSRDREDWGPRLAGVVRTLFPAAPDPNDAPVSTPVLAVDSSRSTGVGWGVVGGGAAVVIAASVLRVLAEAKRSDAEEAQAKHNASTNETAREALAREAEDAAQRSSTLGAVSNVGFGLGAVLITGGTTYLLFGGD